MCKYGKHSGCEAIK